MNPHKHKTHLERRGRRADTKYYGPGQRSLEAFTAALFCYPSRPSCRGPDEVQLHAAHHVPFGKGQVSTGSGRGVRGVRGGGWQGGGGRWEGGKREGGVNIGVVVVVVVVYQVSYNTRSSCNPCVHELRRAGRK